MMAGSLRGKIYILLLFFSISISASCSSATSADEPQQVAVDCKPETDDGVCSLLHQQQAQIDKLQQLVQNLTELVAKLESGYIVNPGIENLGGALDVAGEAIKFDAPESGERRSGMRKVESEGFSGDDVRGVRAKTAAPATKYSSFWSEQFRFVSAVNLNSVAKSMVVLPFKERDNTGKYVAIGDDRGRIHVFFRRGGDPLVEFYTLSESPVTAMISYMSVYKNESLIITGHSSGAILVHRIWEGTGDDLGALQMENVVELSTAAAGESRSAISVLEIHNLGRSRYILSADTKGIIKVFRENGEMYGLVVPKSRPIAFLKQRLMFLTETGAGSLDLRTMKIREVDCEGLNHSLVKNYVFDPTDRLKAYGFTSAGDLIHALLLGDITNFKCRVRSWKNIDLAKPIAFQVIKGYLLIADQKKLLVYNISSQHYARSGAPRLVFSSGIEEIRSSFLGAKAMNKDVEGEKRVPLMASDRAKLIILGFGGGSVGIFLSNLPVFEGESSSWMWTTPVLFFILFMFGAWHFFSKKKEVLTAWGPDDPFTSTSITSGAPVGSSGSGDRSFGDLSARNSDNNGFRGPTRRYSSPNRYPVGSGNSFRPNPPDASSRAPADPNFRGGAELKFRGSNMESSGFQRRENMYADQQSNSG